MTLETIQGSEWSACEESPEVSGDFVRGLLVLGRESKNPWNASVNSPGDTKGPRRKFNVLLSASEEVAKFADKPAYLLHRPSPRDAADNIGSFTNPRVTEKGLRMDLQLLRTAEGLHPQAAALKDNIERRRPFGGFSPRFDFQIDPTTGEVQTIVAVESIDLVPQPASVKSALEEETKEDSIVLAAIEKLGKRLDAVESAVKVKAAESRIQSPTIPAPMTVAASTSAKNFKDFIRS